VSIAPQCEIHHERRGHDELKQRPAGKHDHFAERAEDQMSVVNGQIDPVESSPLPDAASADPYSASATVSAKPRERHARLARRGLERRLGHARWTVSYVVATRL
jgi:hypothetical protein